jgi:hypothetical protein
MDAPPLSAEASSKNAPSFVALRKNNNRKAPVTGKVIEIVAQYSPDLTTGVRWILGHQRFLVIAVTKDLPSIDGTLFGN